MDVYIFSDNGAQSGVWEYVLESHALINSNFIRPLFSLRACFHFGHFYTVSCQQC